MEVALKWLSDPEHWRNRAEEARTIAEQMSTSEARESMTRIAREYDRLAEMLLKFLARSKPLVEIRRAK